MKGHGRLLARSWMLFLGVAVLIAGHGMAYYILRHRALQVAAVSGGILLAVITHLGIGRLVSRRALRPDIHESNKPKAGKYSEFPMEKIASVVAISSTGLLAGAFAYAFFSVVPTFSEVPLEVHFTFRDALMRHNGVYVQILMALSILTPLWWALTTQTSGGRRSLAILASLSAATSFIVTRFGNVPINQMIKTWPAAAPPFGYTELLGRWLVFHNVRTVTALGSFLCVVLAETLFKRQ